MEYFSRNESFIVQITRRSADFNAVFFGGRSATTGKMDLSYSEEMWRFFVEDSDLEQVATKLGYALTKPGELPKAPIMQ